MNRGWTVLWVGLAIVVGGVPAAAQQIAVHGEVRPRYEARDPVGTGMDEFTSMRVRLAVDAALDEQVSVFVQFQDVRIWGEETGTLSDFSGDNIDLHQGYLRYQGERLDWLTATVGRMEAAFGEERLVGPVGWTQQGRSFDGARVDVTQGWGSVALVAYRLGDETAPTVAEDQELYGAYATVADVGPGALDVYWLYDRTEGATDLDRHSVGSRYAFSLPGDVDARLEGTVQSGTRGAADLASFMLGARLGKSFLDGDFGATLWYDYLSGDDPASAEIEVFNTLYATNHPYYGFADLFTDIPTHTGGAGLQDLALKLAWRPTDAITLAADAHSFLAAEQGSLSGKHLADELDLTLSHRYSQFLTATAGFSLVLQDDPLAEIGRLAEDMKWFYVMLHAAF